MNASSGMPVSYGRALGRVLAKLWLLGIAAAIWFGYEDWNNQDLEMSWYEILDIVGIYALLGAIACLAALPFAALVLVVLRSWYSPGRVARVLFVAASSMLILGLHEVGALDAFDTWIAVSVVVVIIGFGSRPWLASDRPIPRWLVVSFALIGLVLAVGPAVGRKMDRPPVGEKRTEGRPDIVVIVLDTQRADWLGAYGRGGDVSPTFDRLAREGALFTGCYSSAPWTVPSHASLFTGVHPVSHGCSFEHHRHLDERFTTLAEALRERAGYETAAFVANPYLAESNLDQGFETWEEVGAAAGRLAIRPLLELLGWPERYADHGATDAIDAIDGFLGRRAEPETPLFLFVNLLEVHWRYLPVLAERLDEVSPEPGLLRATDISRQFYGPLAMAGKRVRGAEREEVDDTLRRLYTAAVRYQDRKLGELLEVVKRRLALDRTVLVVTSDHGENLGDGGRYDHAFATNEALLHVPLVLRYPPAFGVGTRVDGLCQLVDLPVTLLELAQPPSQSNDPLAEEIAGRSLLPGRFTPREFVLGFGDPYLGHLEAMSFHTGFNRDIVGFTEVQRTIRDATHKLVRSSIHGDRLYDVAGDPAETRDLGASDPARRDALGVKLDAALKALPAYVGPPRFPPVDPDHAVGSAGLKQLGYVNERNR